MNRFFPILCVAILAAFAGSQAWAQALIACDYFTATVGGCVPPSGGGTTNFLRADGTWATPPAGVGTLPTTAANQVLAGPATPGATAAAAVPRALVAADMPPVLITRETAAYTLSNADLGHMIVLHGSTGPTTFTLPAITTTGLVGGEQFLIANDDSNVLTVASASPLQGPVSLCKDGWDLITLDLADGDWQLSRSSDGTCP
jgi:hypothetical protein